MNLKNLNFKKIPYWAIAVFLTILPFAYTTFFIIKALQKLRWSLWEQMATKTTTFYRLWFL